MKKKLAKQIFFDVLDSKMESPSEEGSSSGLEGKISRSKDKKRKLSKKKSNVTKRMTVSKIFLIRIVVLNIFSIGRGISLLSP